MSVSVPAMNKFAPPPSLSQVPFGITTRPIGTRFDITALVMISPALLKTFIF
jgi:hypothetical protein